jgi:non-ribosomal peptide synthetase component F
VPARLSGRAREETAVAVAREVDRTAPRSDAVVVATRRNWPDAVAAGSLGAGIGMPILLTDRDGLHPATAAYLAERRRAGTVGSLYVVGGDAVVSDAAASAAAGAAGLPARRLAGTARDATATAVATEQRALLGRRGAVPGLAVAIDLDRADGYAHALSASVLAGTTSAVFVPVRGAGSPERLTAHTRQRFCGLGLDGALAGGADLLPDSLGSELVALLAGDPSRC